MALLQPFISNCSCAINSPRQPFLNNCLGSGSLTTNFQVTGLSHLTRWKNVRIQSMTEKCPPTALWPGSFPRVPFPGLPLPHLCATPLRYHQIADFLGQILPKARLFGRSCPQMYGLSWSCEKVSSIFYAGSPLPTRCPDVIRPSIYERFTPQKPQASLYLTITAWIFMTEGLLWQDHGPLSSQTWNHQMARP